MGIATVLKDKAQGSGQGSGQGTNPAGVASVQPDSRMADIVDLLVQRRIGAVLVLDGGMPVGIVSERDIVRCLAVKGADVMQLVAKDVMTAPVITIRPDESLCDAMELMTDRRIRHLPVVESGALVGIVSIGDLVKRRIAEAEQEAMALKDYISTA